MWLYKKGNTSEFVALTFVTLSCRIVYIIKGMFGQMFFFVFLQSKMRGLISLSRPHGKYEATASRLLA